MEHNSDPLSRLETFIKPYTFPANPDAKDVVDLENPSPLKGADLPASPALELLADIYEEAKTLESIEKAVDVSLIYCALVLDSVDDLDLEISGKRTRYHAQTVSEVFEPHRNLY